MICVKCKDNNFKAPVEILYLETSQIPIKDIISVRRLLYLHEILSIDQSELIYQIYSAMKEAPLKDDWIHLVEDDKIKFKIDLKTLLSPI